MSLPASDEGPRFPTQPLKDYAQSKGMSVRELERAGGVPLRMTKYVSLEHADALCIDVLKAHPYEVFGNLYFTA